MDPEKNIAVVTGSSINTAPRFRGQIATRSFAGRVGGNQVDVTHIEDDDDEYSSSRQPDATPLSSIRSAIALEGFLSADLWRLALLEGLGSFLIVFVLGAIGSGLSSSDLSASVRASLGSVGSWVGLSLFTYCLGPASGAHLTPVITLTTFFIGLTTLPRATLYIVAQIIGAVVAGYWLKTGTGNSYFAAGIIPGCSVDTTLVTPGQLFVLEFGFCLMMIFLACGLGLDPRQHNTLSPSYAPVLIGACLGLATLASSFAAPGYTGMSFNPARCLGLMAPTGNLQYYYIHWAAPLAAALFNGLIYRIVPPWIK